MTIERIYVAGAWVEQHTRARPMMAALRAAGLTITHDWTVPEGDVCECGDLRAVHDARLPTGEVTTACRACTCVAFNGIGQGSDANLTAAVRLEHALQDIDGVKRAEILWLLAPNVKGSSGSWVELGLGIAFNDARKLATDGTSGLPHIIISGPKNKRVIFTEFGELHDTDAGALARILRLAGRVS